MQSTEWRGVNIWKRYKSMNDRLAFINRQLLLLAQLNAINRWNNCKRLKSLADTWLAYWGKSVKMRSRADNFKWPPRTPSIWSSDGGGLSLHTKQLIMGHNKLWQTFQNVISLDSNRFSAVLATIPWCEGGRRRMVGCYLSWALRRHFIKLRCAGPVGKAGEQLFQPFELFKLRLRLN